MLRRQRRLPGDFDDAITPPLPPRVFARHFFSSAATPARRRDMPSPLFSSGAMLLPLVMLMFAFACHYFTLPACHARFFALSPRCQIG